MSQDNAIVIGGGPAGLAAAAHLARDGRVTTLLEAKASLGGRAASHEHDGFTLNQGPHALYAGGIARRELDALGVSLELWNPVSPGSFLIRDGRARRTPGGTGALVRFLTRALRTDPASVANLSVSAWLDTAVAPRARAGAEALVRVATFVADHDALSADVAAAQLRLAALKGVRYIDGGWQTLADGFADVAREAGASVRTRTAVRALQREGDAWSVALDDGETLSAGVVVVAAGGPSAFTRLLGEDAPAAPGPEAEVSVLDIGLDALPARRRRFALGLDEPTYFSCHSPDGTLVTTMSYAHQGRERLEALADAMQPGWRERTRTARFLPSMSAVSAIATPSAGGLAGRPAVARGDGLFCCGDWLGSEGWLADAAVASGVAAARAARSVQPAAVAA